MRAVILAGGLGTRMRPYTSVIPKPLLPIGDRPVLEHLLRTLARDGVREVDLCVSHLGGLIQAYFAHAGVPGGIDLRFHYEEEPLGTAGALTVVPGLEGTFLAMNGDILTTLDYGELVAHHREHEAALTIAMHHKPVGVELGVISSHEGLVTGYDEKPTMHFDVSMGIYVYDERALAHLPSGPCQFPELVVRLLDAGERVAAYRSGAEWFDIGTVAEYERASQAVRERPERFDLDAPGVPDQLA
jgi:NDP-sugar pyrophosphorylase family protein